MHITFVVPGNNRSGGVRVTVSMANQLLCRGHSVRIVYPKTRILSKELYKTLFQKITKKRDTENRIGWIQYFQGKVEQFKNLDDLTFESMEIVIAVGTLTINCVYKLNKDVVKLRYNHGLLSVVDEKYISAWKLPMPTITVSKAIIPDLEKISKQKVLAVVRNGIDLAEYRPTGNGNRNGIGCMYSSHPAKAPEIIKEVFKKIKRTSKGIPLYSFSTEKCPKDLYVDEYWEYPSVEKSCSIYNRSRIWLVASRSEGFSIPILEAMACGCVVISTDTYGGRELIVDGENGILVPVGDSEAILSAIKRILSCYDLEKRIVMNGLKFVKSFSWSKSVEDMENIIKILSN